MAAAEPLTIHVWMPDGRSLCDRRAPRRKPEAESPIAEVERNRDAPSCGACALLIHALRCDLAISHIEGRSMWPATPADALRSLAGTRWDTELDLEALQSTFTQVDLVADLMVGLNRAQLEEYAAARRQRFDEEIAKLVDGK